jgi:hypothetical protein
VRPGKAFGGQLYVADLVSAGWKRDTGKPFF